MWSARSSAATALVVSIALVASLAGCGDADPESAVSSTTARSALAPLPTAVQAIDIVGLEYSFDITPDPSAGIRPGWTRINFENTGVEAHQVMFARLKDGVDMAQLAAAGAGDSSGSGAIAFVDMLGGVSYIGAGNGTTALVDLPEGTVMAMCYVPDALGVAHALMGMSKVLNVTKDAPEPVAVSPPANEPVQGVIELSAGGYKFPERVQRGWYQVRNTDEALHELALLRLERAVDGDELQSLAADLAANKTPTIEMEAVGGLGAISAGFTGYLDLDLEPGEYLAVDFMPDPGNPRPHMLDGYYGRFTVDAK